jgi:hypothetical protein
MMGGITMGAVGFVELQGKKLISGSSNDEFTQDKDGRVECSIYREKEGMDAYKAYHDCMKGQGKPGY